MDSKKEEVLRQLKLVRKAKNLSYQDIVDGTEELGMAVSMSSVKRVFAEDSKACDFRYTSTLRPIVRFVMGLEGDLEEPKTIEEAKASVEGLAAVVDYKDALIAKLEQELTHLREDHRSSVERMESAEGRKIAYLRAELDAARSTAKTAEASLSRWRAISFLIMAGCLVAHLVVIVFLLFGR